MCGVYEELEYSTWRMDVPQRYSTQDMYKVESPNSISNRFCYDGLACISSSIIVKGPVLGIGAYRYLSHGQSGAVVPERRQDQLQAGLILVSQCKLDWPIT